MILNLAIILEKAQYFFLLLFKSAAFSEYHIISSGGVSDCHVCSAFMK